MKSRCQEVPDMDQKGINPFFLGAEFINYCIRQAYLQFELDEEKKAHYYVTDLGRQIFQTTYQIDLTKPCAYEKEG